MEGKPENGCKIDCTGCFFQPPPPCSRQKWQNAIEPSRHSLKFRNLWNRSSGCLIDIVSNGYWAERANYEKPPCIFVSSHHKVTTYIFVFSHHKVTTSQPVFLYLRITKSQPVILYFHITTSHYTDPLQTENACYACDMSTQTEDTGKKGCHVMWDLISTRLSLWTTGCLSSDKIVSSCTRLSVLKKLVDQIVCMLDFQ